MWKHYFITAARNLTKRKLFTLINIIGLSLGIATFLVIIKYVEYEFNYDSHLPKENRVYRVDYYEYQNNEAVLQTAQSHTALSTYIKQNVPEVQHVAKAFKEECLLFNDKAKAYQKGLWVDSTFLDVFEVKLLQGNARKALVAPMTMAISQTLAKTYFGKENPIGKTIKFNEHIVFTISAVFQDLPQNTSVKFNFLVSMATLYKLLPFLDAKGNFFGPAMYTFLTLNPQVSDIGVVNDKLSKIAADNIGGLKERNVRGQFQLRPLKEIHFSQHLTGELEPGRNKVLLYVLISVAIFILIAAWMNYINLSLAQAFQRAEEIVVRKVYGASVSNISSQFVAEAIILGLATSATGFILYKLFIYFLSEYISKDFLVNSGDSFLWVGYIFMILIVTLLASVYPGKLIAKYKPAFILRKQYNHGGKNYLQRGLIIFQLFLSVLTIGCTLTASKQLAYMQSFDVGFNTEETISLRGPASRNTQASRYPSYVAFRNEVLSHSQFVAGTASMTIPGEELRFHDESIRMTNAYNDRKQSYWISQIDEGYIETYGLKLLAGRNIKESDTQTGVLINETTARSLGFKMPHLAVNAEYMSGDDKRTKIIGVIKDFHHESLRKKMQPVIFQFQHPGEFGYYTFRVKSKNTKEALTRMQDIWKKHYPDDPFEYYFMDSYFAKQYQSEELFGNLLRLFSIMSVIIASLGLLGLSSLSVVKRTKEIGIRKVLGGSVFRVILLLSKDYVRLTFIAFGLALPLFYYVMNLWLQTFSYRIEFSWWLFLLPGVIILGLTWLIVSLQSLKAALANPVKSLRSE